MKQKVEFKLDMVFEGSAKTTYGQSRFNDKPLFFLPNAEWLFLGKPKVIKLTIEVANGD